MVFPLSLNKLNQNKLNINHGTHNGLKHLLAVRFFKLKIMTSIIIYLLLAGINLPFALDKKNKLRTFSWFVIGFQIGLLTSHVIRYGLN